MSAAMAASVEGRRWAIDQRQPADILTLAFRGILKRFRIRGLRGASRLRFYHRYLPDMELPAEEEADLGAADEFDDLVGLLLDHRSDDSEETEWLAYAIVSACFGANHLWQDMGLPNRGVLSELLSRHFAPLHGKNVGNMKWKKFFYKQLCERMEINICKAPTCQACSDYNLCFGPEED
jgi:nitrogen fixation protein NifQ